MEVVSKLFKTQLKVIKIKREDDKLMLLGDPADPMSANSSMTAKDVGDMAGLALSWDVVLWAILFPFYYVGTLLQDQDLDQKIFTGAYVIGNIFIALLLLSSYTYLGTYPFLSALVFFGFAAAFSTSFFVSERYGFLYPAAVLAVVAYYLLLAGFGTPSIQFPVFSLPVLALILTVGIVLEKKNKEEISNVLYWSGFTVVFYFLAAICYTSYNTDNYLAVAGWVAVSSLVGFAVYYGVRAWQEKREFLSYVMLFFLTLTIIVGLSMLGLSATEQGFVLFHVGLFYALAGTGLQRLWGFELTRPYYVLGLGIPIASFLTFYNLFAEFAYGMLIFTAGCLLVSASIYKKPVDDEDDEYDYNDDEPDPAQWFKKAFQYVGNTFGYAALAFYCLSGFPVNALIISAAPFTALAYLYTGMRTSGSFIESRNQFLYLFSIFAALFLYSWLWQTNPLKSVGLNMVFSVVPIGILLFLGARFSKKDDEAKATTAYESINLFILLSIALPVFTEAYSPVFALLVTVVLIAVVGAAFITAHHSSLNYAPVLLTASVFYSLLYFVIPSFVIIGFAFMFFGIAGMALAITSYRKEKVWSNALLFAWIVGTVISLALFSANTQVLIYSAAVWAMTFTLGALYIQRPEQEEVMAD